MTVTVDAVIFFEIVDAEQALCAVDDYRWKNDKAATNQTNILLIVHLNENDLYTEQKTVQLSLNFSPISNFHNRYVFFKISECMESNMFIDMVVELKCLQEKWTFVTFLVRQNTT